MGPLKAFKVSCATRRKRCWCHQITSQETVPSSQSPSEGLFTLVDTLEIRGWIIVSCGTCPGPFRTCHSIPRPLLTRCLLGGPPSRQTKRQETVCSRVCLCMEVHKCSSLRSNAFQSHTQELYIKSQGNFLLSLKHLERENHYEF